MSGKTKKIVPLTIKEVKETLTPAERDEADNPGFLRQLELFIEGANNTPDPDERGRKYMVESVR